jgi:hemerythrin
VDLLTKESDLSVGVKILDLDHREMAGTLAQLRTGEVRGEDWRLTGALLRKLANFTLVHFALEEGMMLATKYPGIDLHRAHHHRMMEQMQALVALYSRGGLTTGRPSLDFLFDGHSIHVQKDDLSYGEWLNRGNGEEQV